MEVEYKVIHHEDKPCEREIVIPEGWERVRPEGRSGDKAHLVAVGDRWLQYAECPMQLNRSSVVIRPIARITLEVGAWYELAGHGIHQAKPPNLLISSVCLANFEYGNHRPNPGCPRILRRVYVSERQPVGSEHHEYMVGDKPMIFCCKHSHSFKCPACNSEPVAERPFRLSGPGWYRTEGGGWQNLYMGIMGFWSEDGKAKRSCFENLIARATPEQERVLEGR